MAADNKDAPVSVDRSVGNSTSQVGRQKRLESLLFDDSDSMRAVEHIANQEVKVVGSEKTSRSGPLLILLLFLILLLGGSYYFLKAMPLLQPPETQPNYYVSPKLPIPDRPEIDLVTVTDMVAEEISVASSDIVPAEKSDIEIETTDVLPSVNIERHLFTVNVGPFINTTELEQAIRWLKELGFESQKSPGHGPVTMIRLLEGIYSAAEALEHLATLKQVVNSAFVLPDGDKLAVYAGSFHQENRARKVQDDLAEAMINVALIDSEVTMNGTMLTVLQADQQTAHEISAHISRLGLHAQIIEQKVRSSFD